MENHRNISSFTVKGKGLYFKLEHCSNTCLAKIFYLATLKSLLKFCQGEGGGWGGGGGGGCLLWFLC